MLRVLLATGYLLVSAEAAVSGSTTSTECTVLSGQCSRDGSSNYVSRSLTYNTLTGVFSGSITTNGCSNNAWGLVGGVSVPGGHQASCIKQTLPAPAYTTVPAKAPLRGIVGYSIAGGVDIYGPFEAGFTAGQACSVAAGVCDAGVDIATCDAKLSYECGTQNLKPILDDCGGHAQPYHYHYDLACDYNRTTAGHSTLTGVMLDGRGIYGLYESTGQRPTDLDACGGHYGNVPAYTRNGVNYTAATNVYHYHAQTTAPFTLGCFGPVTTLAQCKSLYATCGTGYVDMVTSAGCVKDYDTDCPCFRMGSDSYNQVSTQFCSSVVASTHYQFANGSVKTDDSTPAGNVVLSSISTSTTATTSSSLSASGSGSRTSSIGFSSSFSSSSRLESTTATAQQTATGIPSLDHASDAIQVTVGLVTIYVMATSLLATI